MGDEQFKLEDAPLDVLLEPFTVTKDGNMLPVKIPPKGENLTVRIIHKDPNSVVFCAYFRGSHVTRHCLFSDTENSFKNMCFMRA